MSPPHGGRTPRAGAQDDREGVPGPAADPDQAAAYALAVAEGYLRSLESIGRPARGLAVLELGPGRDLGPALLLAGLGADVTVADRFLVRWDDRWHPAVYRALAGRLSARTPPLSSAALDAVLAAGAHEAALTAVRAPLERLGPRTGLRDGRFDVTFSNAVLEHVMHAGRACRRLAALTAPGGHGFHQIDLRDHRDFERPLQHLADHPLAFALRHVRHRGALGTRWRAAEFRTAFERAGLAVVDTEVNLRADAASLAAHAPRLRPRWRRHPDLAILSARFHVRRR